VTSRLLSTPRPSWLRLPRRTVRLRLTLLYGGLFLLCGAALLTVTYVLVVHATDTVNFKGQTSVPGGSPGRSSPGSAARVVGGLTPTQLQAQQKQLEAQAAHQHAAELHQLLLQSGVALALMAFVSIALGWLVAGRVLRPLRTITTAVRDISANNLDQRLALAGPEDELKELGETFDELVGRLEASFQAQRRFVANASHELRTPLALGRAMLEVALDDANATVDSLRSTCHDVISVEEQQEHLIESLLTLAHSQQGLAVRTPVDLAAITDQVTNAHQLDASTRGITIHTTLDRADVAGDAKLIERLVTNLIDNALRYNVPGGRVEITVSPHTDKPTLTVANTGPLVAETHIERLLQPFQRLSNDRQGEPDGHGLGLSIVHAIATAHDAVLNVHPRPDGGLAVDVRFPSLSLRITDPSPA
jgi:signal transduction histidine kinase